MAGVLRILKDTECYKIVTPSLGFSTSGLSPMVDGGAADKKNAAAGSGSGLWYRYRHGVYALVAANAAIVAYVLINHDRNLPKKPLPSVEPSSADAEDLEKDGKSAPVTASASQVQPDQPKAATVTSSETKPQESHEVHLIPSPLKPEIKLEQHLSKNEQIEIYEWMLAEKRKMKPSSSKEKARNDFEKGILKDYIRGKAALL